MTLAEAAEREMVFELWRKGRASDWLLDEGQQAWRVAFWGTPELASTVWNVGRQRGKTFAAVFMALEFGSMTEEIAAEMGRPFVKRPIIRYCAKTKESAVGIVKPAWDFITSTMPPEMRPTQGRTDYEWVFPQTGATFVLFGTDAQSFTKGRGPRTDLQFLDECGFYQDLVSVESALLPSLQTTGGRALYLSTPAESVGHPYTQRIYAAMASGRYVHDTFWSNPRVNHEGVIEAERTRLGMTREVFLLCTYFRREYLAEILTDTSRAAMPAWNLELAKIVVGDWPRPAFFDAYQAHDAGISADPHASLFGLHDFATNRIIIEDEMELRSAAFTIKGWSDQIKIKETHLYGTTSWDGTVLAAKDWKEEYGGLPEYLQKSISTTAPRQPYLRVADNAQGMCGSMSVDYGLATMPYEKKPNQKAYEADRTNQLLATHRILIHSRCVRLIAQLHSTIWNKSRDSWEHTDLDHGDLVDDLIMMQRHIRWHRDCRPPVKGDVFSLPKHMQPSSTKGLDAMKGAFGRR